MKFILKSLECICIMLTLIGVAYAKEWHGIVPLRSTRADVERVLGPPSPISKSVYGTSIGKVVHETKEAVVIVDYSERGCERGKSSGWNVPLNTVLAVTVNPRSKVKLSELSIDLSKYEMVRDEEVRTAIYYVNKEEGIYLETRDYIDYVVSTTYLPTAKDWSKFRCPK